MQMLRAKISSHLGIWKRIEGRQQYVAKYANGLCKNF